MRKWKSRLQCALLVAAGYLLIFLTGKLLSDNPGLSLWEWLLDNYSVHYSYLYGWLISHGRFLYASLISMLPALFGKRRFSLTSLAGFAVGLLLGELLGQSILPSLHYGWAIWGFIFLISCVMGIVLERFSKYEVNLRSRKFRVWLVVFLGLIAAALVFVRMNMP